MTTHARRRGARGLVASVALAALAAGIPVALDAPAASAATVDPAVRYEPSRIPDRITLLPAADATTGQVVTWRTSPDVLSPVVEYRTLTPTPYPSGVQTVVASTGAAFTTDLGYSQVVHTGEMTGLVPGAAYMYRVGDGTNFSEWQDFETATATPSDFSFIYLGDLQNGILSQTSRVVRNAFRDRPNADVVVQIGDLVDDADSDQQWAEVHEAFDYTLGTQTLLTTPGNHEYEGDLSTQWAEQFVYPDNGPTGEGAIYDELDGSVYFTDRQGVRFISLNSNVATEDGLAVQAEWLEGVLAQNPNEWTVVFFHHPVYSLDEGRNNLGIRTIWGPLLEQYDVDLVLQGHDHAYGRGNSNAAEQDLPAGADPELSHTGPVYIGSTASEKMYEAGSRLWDENDAHLRRLAVDQQFYQLVDVREGVLRYESRTADGEFFDGFTITKSDGQKLVTDGVDPQVIEPTEPAPCLGCEEPGEGPGEELDPGTPAGTIAYEQVAQLDSVQRQTMAALPAGVAYHQDRDVLYLGDQNGRRIFEIDPDTDAVLREMTLPENIRDIGVDEENELLYVGQQNRNWIVVSIADATFGEVVRGPYTIIESNRSIDVDPANDLAYAAIPSRGVEVFRASTGESLGVISGTSDAYYVAAEDGKVVATYFHALTNVVNVEVFDALNGFTRDWSIATRISPRQVDIDSTNGLVYIGYTGTSAERGGFSVHDLETGEFLADMVGPQYGKDGYGITVDEERQRVFVSNRDFRLNPPGEELTPFAVTVSQRIADGEQPTDPTDPVDPVDPVEPVDPPSGTGYAPTAMQAIQQSETEAPRTVGSVVDSRTGNLFVGNEQRPARVWEVDPETDAITRVITVPGGTDEGVRDIALNEAADELIVGYSSSIVVLDATTGAVKRGPFAASGSIRGMDVDAERGLAYAATRGTGFDVVDLTTGALTRVSQDVANWRSHGVAVDPETGRIFVSNSDQAGATEAVRVYAPGTHELVDSLAYTGSGNVDLRSIAVDTVADRVYVGHQNDLFDQGGFAAYTLDLEPIGDYRAYAYGSKVYGVSVDSAKGAVYLSARDGYPMPLVVAQRDEAPVEAAYTPTALTVLPTEDEDARPVGSVVDSRTGDLFIANEQRPARVWQVDPVTDSIVRTIDVPVPTAADDGVRDVALDEAADELYVAYGNKWAVLDATSGALLRGPFQFSANVRGMDVADGRVYGGLRGTGFEVMDATTGALIETVTADIAAWSTHGVAVDRSTGLVYLSNSDQTAATEGVRVYDPATLELVRSLPWSGAADLRSIAIDSVSGRVIVGHQDDLFDNGGFSVFATADLSALGAFKAYAYGQKVYGVSVDESTGTVYSSARDRYPSGLIASAKVS